MPRIDPQQLLNCLQVLLNPSGGILSKDEVVRLANLMTKFSKKLVSKCIYVLILKNTEKTLLGSFMSEGGWNLIHMWLQDAHGNKNWALVIEILQLLLLTPVDVERLKMNNLPKLVKSLTKRDDLSDVQHLASTLVEEWLKIVKDVTKAEAKEREAMEAAQKTCEDPLKLDENKSDIEVAENDITGSNTKPENVPQVMDNQENVEPLSDNVETVCMEANNDQPDSEKSESEEKKDKKPKLDDKSKHKSSSSSRNSKDSRSDRSKSKHSSSSSSSKTSRDKDRKDKDKHRSSSSSSSSSKHKSSKSSSSSSRDKDKNRDKEKDKKDSKEKQLEKDKDTLSKIIPPTIDKLGRIPKKTDSDKSKSIKKEEVKKPTFSVEVRKTDEKPKTVKIFNSKMRSTGLLEEAKPPPPRSSTKKPVIMPPPVTIKRPSPIRDVIPPPEKKSRLLEPIERPGAIKLIPPKPKPAVLQESDIFMDALTASATSKKEPKKRKRKPSVTKEPSPPPADVPTSPTSSLKNISSGFYQDTLDTETDLGNETAEEENKPSANGEEETSNEEKPVEEGPENDTVRTDSNGLRGVLSYSKRKGPKKSIKWKPEADLVEIQYFELDETERVNVMKTFGDMAKLEMSGEREALRSRKLANEDIMEQQTQWRALIELDLPASQVDIGSKSLEKEIQFAREKRVLQTIYFNNRIPDTPADPDPETHPMTDPVVIPLEDPDNPDVDSQLHPWPEPKGSPPHIPNTPPIFNNVVPPFIAMGGPAAGFPPTGVPPFAPPGFMPPMMRPPGEWNGIPNGMPPRMPPPQELINQGPPPIFDNFGPNNMPDNGFQPPFNNQPNMPMFPPNNFNNNMRGRGGAMRRGGGGPWIRMGGPGPAPKQGPWINNNSNRGGGGHNRGNNRFCHNIKKFGFCRHRDTCPFMHPN